MPLIAISISAVRLHFGILSFRISIVRYYFVYIYHAWGIHFICNALLRDIIFDDEQFPDMMYYGAYSWDDAIEIYSAHEMRAPPAPFHLPLDAHSFMLLRSSRGILR